MPHSIRNEGLYQNQNLAYVLRVLCQVSTTVRGLASRPLKDKSLVAGSRSYFQPEPFKNSCMVSRKLMDTRDTGAYESQDAQTFDASFDLHVQPSISAGWCQYQ